MSRIYPPDQPIAGARTPRARVLLAAFGGLMITLASGSFAAGTQTRPAASLHQAKPLKTLPTLKAARSGTDSFLSPYARAAAERNESGRSGHRYVPPRSSASPDDHFSP